MVVVYPAWIAKQSCVYVFDFFNDSFWVYSAFHLALSCFSPIVKTPNVTGYTCQYYTSLYQRKGGKGGSPTVFPHTVLSGSLFLLTLLFLTKKRIESWRDEEEDAL